MFLKSVLKITNLKNCNNCPIRRILINFFSVIVVRRQKNAKRILLFCIVGNVITIFVNFVKSEIDGDMYNNLLILSILNTDSILNIIIVCFQQNFIVFFLSSPKPDANTYTCIQTIGIFQYHPTGKTYQDFLSANSTHFLISFVSSLLAQAQLIKFTPEARKCPS